MNKQDITIAIDAMGGDYAPSATVQGAVQACTEMETKIVLVGQQDAIKNELRSIGSVPDNISIVHAPDLVTMDDQPTVVVRKKRNSSIMAAFSLAKMGQPWLVTPFI